MISVPPFAPDRRKLSKDESLAEAIDDDGRSLIEEGINIPLGRYTEVVPDLFSRALPLDAAIDVVLRSSARARGATRPEQADADLLTSAYPVLRQRIRDALSLDKGLLTTGQMHVTSRPEPLTGLPRDFGPPLPDGRARYTLSRIIGAGTSGMVYAAIDRHLSEADRPAEVAIKVLRARRGNRWLARRLTEEATKARRVDHPSVVRVVDRGGELTESPFIVYELVKGGDLQAWFEASGRRVPIRRAVEIVAQAARGVHAAHSAGLVHSDLKPENVLLDGSGCVKVADFGIAARLHRSLMDDAEPGGEPSPCGPVGNMAYISPEQFRAEPGCFSAPADVYALGGILYYLVTGRYPNGESPADVARNHGDPQRSARTAPPSLAAHNPGVDRSLDLICARAMASVAAERCPSAAEFAADLEAWLQHRPIRWQSPSIARTGALWVRRRPGTAALCALAVLLLVGGVVSTVHYIGVINDRNARLQAQNQANAEAIELVAELEKFVRDTRPDDPRAKFILDKTRNDVLPNIKKGIQRIEPASPPPELGESPRPPDP